MDTPTSAPAIDSDDDVDWEEVQVATQITTPYPELEEQLVSEEPRHLEITIGKTKQDEPKKKKGISYAERMMRIDCHKIHTICLLVNARIRNHWLNDPLLHARLMSLSPLALQNSFAMIHKSRVPDANKRGRLFEAEITRLAEWWSQEFFTITNEGAIRNLTFEYVNECLIREGVDLTATDAVISEEELQDILDDDGEQIRSEKSLMKHALMGSGSKDVSAQLFTALCRALAIPSRLVVSLQSVPWQSNAGKAKQPAKKKTKAQAQVDEADNENEDMQEVVTSSRSTPFMSEKAKGKQKAKNDDDTPTKSPSGSKPKSLSPPESSEYPVFWTEVFSRADGKWICVDPIRCIVNKRKAFDPTPAPTVNVPTAAASALYPSTHPLGSSNTVKTVRTRHAVQDNRMLYVLAFEEDGFARDVTRRYAREFSSKVSKAQGGNGRKIWWEVVVGSITRPYRLLRDDVEDEELDTKEMLEPMPTTLSGFKDHPIYLLARHLKQTEALYPPPPDTPVLGNFRGEPVYPRSAVVALKTPENWMRKEGRQVKEGSVAMKFIKMRAGTVGKQREIEGFRERLKDTDTINEGVTTENGELLQGLYARHQTEPYVPEPVVDGKVPKNVFGNVDLYVPSMLPRGGVHLAYKGIAKIAKKLGVDYGEAITGFEFKKRRAFPIVDGIVVAQENESLVLEAFLEAEQQAAANAEAKKRERAIKRWMKLIQGLRIRERLKAQYGSRSQKAIDDAEAAAATVKRKPTKVTQDQATAEESAHPSVPLALVTADDIVKPYHLPKDYLVHAEPHASSESHAPVISELQPEPSLETYTLHTLDADPEHEEMDVVTPRVNTVQTLQEMAEIHENIESSADDDIEDLGEVRLPTPPPPVAVSKPPAKTVAKKGRRASANVKVPKKEPPARKTRGKRKRAESEDADAAAFTEDEEGFEEPKRTRTTRKPVIQSSTRVLRSRTVKGP